MDGTIYAGLTGDHHTMETRRAARINKLTQAALSQRTILVADSSKFGRIQPAAIGALTQFDTLVTDCALLGTYQDFTLDNGIMLIYPGC
ncbi:MAG: hypothetical protein ACR5LC_01350 [Symbiopectobacterium sp.]|uniref:hypothetical protein n=1 Tax=Symbiopectobacterium sp. TaxID=2952789 RepID=UPI003F3AF820